ncbi:uncharacterized protein L3040_008276 [Drepanopeziza brunnea f. sp. 'multigermtubi']|uniref:uncharacterized protein n=1 Tax=Drepanopeziza brunnea f. sp. 'multigermtubi' TaxID=698441 RepID=UPI00239CA91B|nr:hypothetical protein L3040_008276 [Drepanopeziza brunnea f. sp. 'multigermtubi']
MFGAALNKPTGGGGLFGSLNTNNQQNQQQGSSLFGGLGQTTQQNQNQGGGLFGQSTQNQNQGGGLFGQSTQNQPQTQQGGGLFGGLGQTQAQNQQPQQNGGLFNLGQSQNNQQQQQQQPNGLQNSLFGQSTQQTLPQLGQSQALWQPNSGVTREKDIQEQMKTVLEKWDTANPNCAFKHYFYNKVDDNMAPYYRPAPDEDPKAWEEALSKKPGPGYIPVLCVGFAQMGERIALQQRNLSNFNVRLHEINNSLTKMMQDHETKTSIRVIDARRKHIVLKQRCLALATKVQVLKNRGYAMAGDEEDLRTKLLALERNVTDPGLGARGEEIWARMLIVQDRARTLKGELEKAGANAPDILDEKLSEHAKRLLEDYNTQLRHLKSELDRVNAEFVEWLKEQGTTALKVKETTKNDTHGRSLQFL